MALFVWETTGTSATDSGSRGYTRTFAVWDEDDDTRFLGPREVLAAPGLPAFGDPFVNDLGEADRESVCSGLSGRPSPETPAVWFVEVTYSSGSESAKEANDESPAESAGGVGPVTGGAVTANRFEQLFLLARAQGRKQPADWAQGAWQVLQLTGQRLVNDGKPLDAEADNLAELTRQAQAFADVRLPVLRALQVV